MQEFLKDQYQVKSKDTVKKLYQEVFQRRLDLIVASNPKKPEKLTQDLENDLQTHNDVEKYQAITLGMNSEDLVIWAKELVTK